MSDHTTALRVRLTQLQAMLGPELGRVVANVAGHPRVDSDTLLIVADALREAAAEGTLMTGHEIRTGRMRVAADILTDHAAACA